MYAAQHMLLDWVHDRFAGKPAAPGCSQKTLRPSRGAESAKFSGFADPTWFIEFDQYGI